MDVHPVRSNAPQAIQGRRNDGKLAVRRRSNDEDGVEEAVDHVELTESVRKPAGNGQEETHEDRQEHGFYDAEGEATSKVQRPKLDLEG